jgi:antitoxin MazE
MKVAKWGNSLAIRLPAAVVEALGLKEGDEIDVRVSKDSALDLMRRPSLEDDIAFWNSLQGTLPADYKFNRDEIYDDK